MCESVCERVRERVCVCERERERERETDRERDRQTDRETERERERDLAPLPTAVWTCSTTSYLHHMSLSSNAIVLVLPIIVGCNGALRLSSQCERTSCKGSYSIGRPVLLMACDRRMYRW